MDDYTQEKQGDTSAGASGYRAIVLRAEKAGSTDFEAIYVRSWEYKDFIERAQSAEPLKMKEIPNAGYRKLSITVQWITSYLSFTYKF